MAEINLGRVVGYSALEIYNKVNGTSLTEEEFVKVLSGSITTFQSMEEAERFLDTDSCTGGCLCSILIDGTYSIFIIQPSQDANRNWDLCRLPTNGGEGEVYILADGETEADIPESAELIIIPSENGDSSEYVTLGMLQNIIPSVTSADDGKFLRVSEGKIICESLPIAEEDSF